MKQPTSPDINDAERKQAVRNFIVASYQNQVHIKTYHRLAMFLSEDRIKLLRPLEMDGRRKVENEYGKIIKIEKWYTDENAERYFEWLVAVINGTEKVGDDIRKQAYDQLFRFLYVMRDDMQRDKEVQLVAPYDWQNLFHAFDMELVDIKRTLEHRDKEIVNILQLVFRLLEQNKKLLETMQKDSEKYFPKGEEP